MMWLRDEAPDGGSAPVVFRFDSEYAAGIAQGKYEAKSNEELAFQVQQLTRQVMSRRIVDWEH
eukprot:3242696-Karenia_brevis.AAC.1